MKNAFFRNFTLGTGRRMSGATCEDIYVLTYSPSGKRFSKIWTSLKAALEKGACSANCKKKKKHWVDMCIVYNVCPSNTVASFQVDPIYYENVSIRHFSCVSLTSPFSRNYNSGRVIEYITRPQIKVVLCYRRRMCSHWPKAHRSCLNPLH